MGSIAVGYSDFFFVPCSCHIDQFIFQQDSIWEGDFKVILYIMNTISHMIGHSVKYNQLLG